ncbi:hypothetical protein ACFQ0K_03895 [Nocardioides caeni]|uniref:DUF4352 domain-containing protein n=1 Tax=Nocardioides caeni TaxID=574700 RepID=A0A4S8MZX5_9ACTN|nr:hypothetical protein [Nocardioides caeni]THV09048.1 hypothetical protein E9934_17845 [Nocardioides caeni]
MTRWSRPALALSLAAVAAVAGACGDDGSDSAADVTATVTVTETVTVGAETEEETTPPAQDGSADAVLSDPGDTVVLGPDDEGDSVEVVLHRVSYPEPKEGGDEPTEGRILVAVEMTITHLSGEAVYGTNVYPNFLTADGQQIADTGWVVAAYGTYGSGQFSEELTDTVAPGNFTQGWGLYEIPPEAGQLVFPFGPDTFSIAVDPAV